MRPLSCLLLVATLLASSRSAAPAGAARPILVELFTSQGCSSCPPADALLGELARRDDVLPLAFHVDYWDRLGWKDPYSSAAATQRQRAYARQLDSATVYTPQMVVDGRTDVVGSYRNQVLGAIDQARAAAAVAVPVELAAQADGLRVRIGGGPALRPATLWLVGFDRHHVTQIGAGENGGRSLAEWNIVRGFEPLGDWQGTPVETNVPAVKLAGYERVAVVLQEAGGRVLGAALAQ
ncbi:MAG: DUF1223 domain-containing protein [Pseudomonadota bacterium]